MKMTAGFLLRAGHQVVLLSGYSHKEIIETTFKIHCIFLKKACPYFGKFLFIFHSYHVENPMPVMK